MDRASEVESVLQGDDMSRTHPGSRSGRASGYKYDRTLDLVQYLLDTGHWDQVLPRYEKQVLIAATANEVSWQHFLEATSLPATASMGSSGGAATPSTGTTGYSKRGAAASAAKALKQVSKSRRGTTTPRRRGAEPDPSDASMGEGGQEAHPSSLQYVETLHTRLRTLISDTLVDAVLFPQERYPSRLPLSEATKAGTFSLHLHFVLDCLSNSSYWHRQRFC